MTAGVTLEKMTEPKPLIQHIWAPVTRHGLVLLRQYSRSLSLAPYISGDQPVQEFMVVPTELLQSLISRATIAADCGCQQSRTELLEVLNFFREGGL
jgi:hypothetical protein